MQRAAGADRVEAFPASPKMPILGQREGDVAAGGCFG